MHRAVAILRWAFPLFFSWNLASAEPSPAAPASGGQDKGETLVFVGRLISIQERVETCRDDLDDGHARSLPFNQGYRARYEVLQRISGRFDGNEVQFTTCSHRGFPTMAQHAQALLFIAHHDGESFLHRYQGYAVHATTDAGWAHCGDLDRRREGDAATPGLGPQPFAGDFGSARQLDEDANQRKFPRDAFAVENDRIVCPRGLALADLYEAVRSGVMKARGVDLPPFADATADR